MAASRSASRRSAPNAFTTITPSKLSWTAADSRPRWCWASLRWRSTRCWYTTFMPASTGNSSTAKAPSSGSVISSQIADTTIISTVLLANGSGAITATAASTSTPARATRSPVGRT